jgi:hypothetical protein
MSYDFGSVPDWIGAFGTIGAFGIAVGIYWQEVKDRHRAQATLISAWWSRVDPEGRNIGSISDSQPDEDVGFRLWVKNGSQEAIYECFLIAEAVPTQAPSGDAPVQIGRFANFLDEHIIVSAGIVPPGEAVQYFVDGDQIASLGAMTVLFRDAAGRSWRRQHGTLEQRKEKAGTNLGNPLRRILR